jgi:glutamine synthetase
MDTMKKVAKRHGLECLLNEKPFAGVNGSGKHDNWSVVTNLGENLLKPGKEPHKNLAFLIFLSAVIAAVDDHALLLRCSASTPGNDNRLGGSEAPPTVISVFLGAQLDDIVHQIIETGTAQDCKKKETMLMGVSSLPKLRKDVTDRNRTSPFAFTGNKFEFRMVSSQQSIAMPNTVLNTIVADALSQFSDALEANLKKPDAKDLECEVMKLVRESLIKHERIIFNGDGYSEEWQKEAARRGLPMAKTMVQANEALTLPETIETFKRQHVLSKTELEARQEINNEFYAKALNIEAKTMIEMAARLYIPAVIRYSKRLADSINAIKETGLGYTTEVQANLLKKLSELLKEASDALDTLRDENDLARGTKNEKERAQIYSTRVKPAMDALRRPIDELEIIVDKRFWPVPTYEDLMFEV